MKNLNDHVDEVQNWIDYQFDNIDLLYQAFTRRSYSVENGGENNEVLEFIGDRVLDYYVTKSLAQEFGYVKSDLNYFNSKECDEFCIKAHREEKDFTELKQELVGNKTLAKIIEQKGYHTMLWLGKDDVKNKVWQNQKVKADLFEAILGAITIDSNWDGDILENSINAMLNMDSFLDTIDDGIERPQDCSIENAINTLKELAEHGNCSHPEYDISEKPEYNSDGNPIWYCTCYVRSLNLRETVCASSKKEAKKYAAYRILCTAFDLPDEYN